MARGLFVPHRFTRATPPASGVPVGGIRMFKLRAVKHWVLDHLRTIEHERRVSRLALAMFDLTRATHDLSPDHRRILRLSAIVHDVGRCKGERNHAARGASMILQDRSLPLTPPERRLLAYLTHHHRGPVPASGADGILVRGDGRAAALRLLALLRAADALDCRSLPSPSLRLKLRADRLCVACTIPTEVSLAKARRAFVKPKKFKLAEQVLDCRVVVKLRRRRERQPSGSSTNGLLIGV